MASSVRKPCTDSLDSGRTEGDVIEAGHSAKSASSDNQISSIRGMALLSLPASACPKWGDKERRDATKAEEQRDGSDSMPSLI